MVDVTSDVEVEVVAVVDGSNVTVVDGSEVDGVDESVESAVAHPATEIAINAMHARIRIHSPYFLAGLPTAKHLRVGAFSSGGRADTDG
jgi:hypothetical protein